MNHVVRVTRQTSVEAGSLWPGKEAGGQRLLKFALKRIHRIGYIRLDVNSLINCHAFLRVWTVYI